MGRPGKREELSAGIESRARDGGTGEESGAQHGALTVNLSRRQVLRGAAVLGGGAMISALLAACGGGEATATATRGATTTTTTTGAGAGGTTTTTAAGTAARTGAMTATTTTVTTAPGGTGTGTTRVTATTRATTGTAAAGGPIPPPQKVSNFTRNASIVEWGFGIQETNPRARVRVEAFRQAYPNINLEVVPEANEQRILTGAASRQLPDILWLGRTDLISYAARGVLRPLDEFIQKDNFDMRRFYEAAVDECRYDNKTFGIPQFHQARALYVNNDHLQELGVDPNSVNTGDWNQLNDLAGRLTKKSGDRVDRWGLDNKADGFLWLWGLANGGKFVSDDGKRITYNDPRNVEALEFLAQNNQVQGGFNAYTAARSTWQGDEQFARGLVSMTLYENFVLGIIATIKADLDFSVLPVRKRGGGPNDWTGFTTGQAWTITQGAKDPEAAWEFIKFMSSLDTWLYGENGVKEYRKRNNGIYTPTLTGDRVADREIIQRIYEPLSPRLDEAVRLLPRVLEQSVKIPVSTLPVNKQLVDTLNNEGVKPALNGERGAKDALDRATQRAQRELDSFQP